MSCLQKYTNFTFWNHLYWFRTGFDIEFSECRRHSPNYTINWQFGAKNLIGFFRRTFFFLILANPYGINSNNDWFYYWDRLVYIDNKLELRRKGGGTRKEIKSGSLPFFYFVFHKITTTRITKRLFCPPNIQFPPYGKYPKACCPRYGGRFRCQWRSRCR